MGPNSLSGWKTVLRNDVKTEKGTRQQEKQYVQRVIESSSELVKDNGKVWKEGSWPPTPTRPEQCPPTVYIPGWPSTLRNSLRLRVNRPNFQTTTVDERLTEIRSINWRETESKDGCFTSIIADRIVPRISSNLRNCVHFVNLAKFSVSFVIIYSQRLSKTKTRQW